jgi:DNA polymerase-1
MTVLICDPKKTFVIVDFEYRQVDGREGNPLEVICGVFKNTSTGEVVRLWQDELYKRPAPPFLDQPNTTLVAYYASAEIACFKALDWARSVPVLDAYVEFRAHTNGLDLPNGRSLVGASQFFGIPATESSHKEAMRELALRGGPYTAHEKADLLDYCAADVEMTEKLLLAMLDTVDYPRALLRGRFCIPLAEMESHGSPVDVDSLMDLRTHWDSIKAELIQSMDADFQVFENGTFKEDLFVRYLVKHQIRWPHHDSGRLKLDDDTFKDMSRVYPQLKPLRTLRDSLAKLRLSALEVGQDGRNRCLLSPFGASTSRNTPSTTRFIFGWPKWARGLIQPKPGRAIAYLDYSQQEFGIAAALSGDPNMLDAYRSDDPYLAFAVQACAVPISATKHSHPIERGQYKQAVLAVQYGMGADSLALRIGQPVIRARQLLQQHRRVYRRFWDWSDGVFNGAVASNRLMTLYGWQVRIKPDLNPRSVRNFPMQATAAEMLRIACILIHEQGVQLCAPVHDAILIEAPDDEIDAHARIAQDCMNRASEIVLYGFRVTGEIRILRYPDRFLDDDSRPFWDQVMALVKRAKASKPTSDNSDTNLSEILTPAHYYPSYLLN